MKSIQKRARMEDIRAPNRSGAAGDKAGEKQLEARIREKPTGVSKDTGLRARSALDASPSIGCSTRAKPSSQQRWRLQEASETKLTMMQAP